MNAPVRTRSRPQPPSEPEVVAQPDPRAADAILSPGIEKFPGAEPFDAVRDAVGADEPVQRVQPAEAVIYVHRVNYDGTEHEHEDRIPVPVFHTTPAEVEVRGGVTRNMGDYNSARVDVFVRLPAYPVRSECTRAYAVASKWVDEWLNRELDIATGQVDPGIDGVTIEGTVNK